MCNQSDWVVSIAIERAVLWSVSGIERNERSGGIHSIVSGWQTAGQLTQQLGGQGANISAPACVPQQQQVTSRTLRK